LKYYTSIQKVTLDKEIALAAWAFAKKVTPTTNYSDSNQLELKKIRTDHFISKLGEEATKNVLMQFGTVRGPDYTIYPLDKKSWDDDLFFNDTGIAVKTQMRSAALKYSLSWTFQAGKFRKDLILERPDAWVIFVECDDTIPYDMYVYPPFQIKELTFEEPKLDHLKGHKKVVYAQTIKLD
jgi:hypothetical protein